ncbi:hypothetical protein ATANTOWER_012582, partial [Ataeniobius toweri]|nr:hypothetical protein [Ataeniobius toweri]
LVVDKPPGGEGVGPEETAWDYGGAVSLILHLDLFVHYKQVGARAHHSPMDKGNNAFTLMMAIDSACHQKLSDNISDLCLKQACFAGALLVPLCLPHTRRLNGSCLFFTADCKLSSHL